MQNSTKLFNKMVVLAGGASEIASGVSHEALQEAKNVGMQAVKNVAREVYDTAGKNVWLGFRENAFQTAMTFIKEIVHSFANAVKVYVKNKDLFKVLFTTEIGSINEVVKDELIGILKNQATGLPSLITTNNVEVKKMLQKMIMQEPIQVFRAMSNEKGMSELIKKLGSPAENAFKNGDKLFDASKVEGVIKKITTEFAAKDTAFLAKLSPKAFVASTVLKVVTWSQALAFIIQIYDGWRQDLMSLNEKIENLLDELESLTRKETFIILNAPVFGKQSPQFIAAIRRSIGAIRQISPKLKFIESQFDSQISRNDQSNPKFDIFYKTSEDTKAAITQLETVFGQVKGVLDQYHRVFMEIGTMAAPFGQSASKAELVAKHIENIEFDLQVFSNKVEGDTNSIVTVQNQVNSQPAAAAATTTAAAASGTDLMLYAFYALHQINVSEQYEDSKKKSLNFSKIIINAQQSPPQQSPPQPAQKPGKITTFMLDNFPLLKTDPAAAQRAITKCSLVLDTLFAKGTAQLGSQIAKHTLVRFMTGLSGKALSTAMESGGVGHLAGNVGGAIMGSITAIDMANSFVNLATNNGTIEDDVKNLISALTQLSSDLPKESTFKKMMDKNITSLSGTTYTINKLIKELQALNITTLSPSSLSPEIIDTMSQAANIIMKIMTHQDSIGKVIDNLKDKNTKELYIKESEGYAAMVGRGVDSVVENVTTMFGLFGKKPGGLNPYNNMLNIIEYFEPKLATAIISIMPIIENLKKFQQLMQTMQSQPANV